MSIRGQRYTSLFLTTSIMLSLLSLIVISVMAVFELVLGVESQNTYLVLLIFTFIPATLLSWSSLGGRVIYFREYRDRLDTMVKVWLTLALGMVLSAFSYYLFANL